MRNPACPRCYGSGMMRDRDTGNPTPCDACSAPVVVERVSDEPMLPGNDDDMAFLDAAALAVFPVILSRCHEDDRSFDVAADAAFRAAGALLARRGPR